MSEHGDAMNMLSNREDRRMRALLAALALATCVATSGAGTVTLEAAADNTLYQDEAGTVSNGRGASFFAGPTALEEMRRGLIRFDFSAIPAGSTITGVTLTLNCTRSISLAEEVTLHRSLQSWGEGASNAVGEGGRGAPAEPGDATWVHRFLGASNWSTPGGDFAQHASATTAVAGIGAYTWSSNEMVSDVQGWLDDASANHGWFVLGAEATPGSAKRFASRENLDIALRPALTVTFVIPGPGSALAFGLAGCAMACRRRRGS